MQFKKIALPVLASSLFLAGPAMGQLMTFEVRSMETDDFLTSYLHTADGCEEEGYYRCGDSSWEITGGSFSGDYDDSDKTLTGISGSLELADREGIPINDGRLGGSFDWYLETNEKYGTFYFVESGEFGFTGDGEPNSFSVDNGMGSTLLWGQNFAADTSNDDAPADGKGLDLYAEGHAVPEPSTLALFGLGLLGLGLGRARRIKG